MAKFFVDRPVMAIVSAIVLVLVGLIAGTSLPIAQYPQITLPTRSRWRSPSRSRSTASRA
jgi:HAE1 family hydrophobic/amphiphilic exporter-1